MLSLKITGFVALLLAVGAPELAAAETTAQTVSTTATARFTTPMMISNMPLPRVLATTGEQLGVKFVVKGLANDAKVNLKVREPHTLEMFIAALQKQNPNLTVVKVGETYEVRAISNRQ